MEDLIRLPYTIGESSGVIIADDSSSAQIGLESIRRNRVELLKHISNEPTFAHSFEPLVPRDRPLICRLMAEAAEKADVGPMAAVAGALADLAVAEMIEAGAIVAVVENGGEIAAHSPKPIEVGFAAGSTQLSRKFAFKIGLETRGIATSSGRYSHAFSFGDADAVTIFADCAAVADSAATAVCNLITGLDAQTKVRRAVEHALMISGVRGVFILYDDVVGTGGNIPEIFPTI
jgi:ApbE superfamily uncharacterized protein (UPF0280 family)